MTQQVNSSFDNGSFVNLQKKCGVSDNTTVQQATRASGYPERSAINGGFVMIEIKPSYKSSDYEGVLEDESVHIYDILKDRMESGLKFYMSLEADMKLPSDESTKPASFQSTSSVLLQTSDINEEIKEHIKQLVKKIEEYLRNGSGWMVENVRMINLMITKKQTCNQSPIVLTLFLGRKISLY